MHLSLLSNRTFFSADDGVQASVSNKYTTSNQHTNTITVVKNHLNTSNKSNLPTTMTNAVQSWKPTILVVDDSNTNRKMLVRSLNSKGLFTCREAEDGLEGE